MLKAGRVVALDTTDNLLRRFATHSLRVRLAQPELAGALGAPLVDGGWAEFGLESYAELEPTLARLREAGADVLEMMLGEADLERVFVEVMNRA
jgi:ABC-2 type transport system ATP-binding protein